MEIKQEKKYAELTLYFGLCESKGCPEGGFRGLSEREEEYSKQKVEYAMGLIRNALHAAVAGEEFPRLMYGFGSDNFVTSEKEARQLTDFLSGKMENVKENIELNECIHGFLKFYRKLRFENLEREDKGKLIELIKETGLPSMSKGMIMYIDDETRLSEFLKFRGGY
jgi:hypothetical protein